MQGYIDNTEPYSVKLFLSAFTLNFMTTILNNYDTVFKILTLTALILAILLNGGKMVYNTVSFIKKTKLELKQKLNKI